MLRKINKSIILLAFVFLVAGVLLCLPFKTQSKALADKTEQVSLNDNSETGEIALSDSSELDSWANDVSMLSVTTSDIMQTTLYGQTVRIIYTAAGLANVAYNVNSGTSGWANGIYVLAANINLLGSVWTPIGTYSHPFTGTFLGEGHTISNIILDYNFADQTRSSGLGIFGRTSGATIAEVRLSGSVLVSRDNGYNTGNLIGEATNNTEIINCRDNTSSDYNTIGSLSDSRVYLSSTYLVTNFSSSGEVTNISTSSDGQSTSSLQGVSRVNGYVVYFISDGEYKFYMNNSLWHDTDGERLRVIVSTDYQNSTDTINNFMFTTCLPQIRESLGVDDITIPYPIRLGYRATIPTCSSANSLITASEMSWASETVSAAFDMGYGTRSAVVTIPYDMSYYEFFTSENQTIAGRNYNGISYMSRAGYELNTILGSRGNNVYQDGAHVYPEGVDRGFYYGYPTSTDDTVFTWTALTNRGFNFRFLIEYEDYSLGGIDYTTFSNNISNIEVSSGDVTTEDNLFQVTGLTAGEDVTISFNLNAGYQLTLASENNIYIDSNHSNNAYSGTNNVFLNGRQSGVYLNFANFTGYDQTYTTVNANNDSYNQIAMTGVVSNTDPRTNRTITLNLSNIVGQNGNVYIVLERMTQTFHVNTNISTLLPNEQKIENSFTWVYNGADYIQESFTIEVRYNQSFVITFLIGDTGNASSDYYTLSVDTGNLANPQVTYNTENMAQIGTNSYYKGFTMTGIVNSLAEDDSITANIGELRASVELSVFNGSEEIILDGADNSTQGMSAVVNGQSLGLSATTFAPLRPTQQDQVVFTTNGYYTPTRIEIIDNATSSVIVNDVFSGSYQASEIFTTAHTGVPPINYSINIYVEEKYYAIDWANFDFNIGGTNYNGSTNYDFLSDLFTLTIYNGSNSASSFLPGQTMRVVLTMTSLGRSILYGDTNNYIYDNAVPSSVGAGFAAGVMTTDPSGANSGVWAFNYVVGTFEFDFTFTFQYKTINLSINGLVMSNSLDVILNDSSLFNTISGSYSYSYNGSQVSLRGSSFGSISIHTQYYLLGWYLANGNVLAQNNYLDITNSSALIDGYMDISQENNVSEYSINLQAVVERRTIALSYQAGNAGKGEIITGTIQSQILNYDTPVTLQSPFTNKGYTFVAWSYTIGSTARTTNQSTFSLTDGDWSRVFGSTASNDMQAWSSFVNNDRVQSSSQTTLTLTATWSAISYGLVIDGRNYNNILQKGDEIRLVASGNKDGGGTYTIYRNGSQSGSGMASGTINGYLAVGFTIEESESFTNDITGSYASFVFDGDNFDQILGNVYNQFRTLTISTEREAAPYKVYIAESDYYNTTVSGTTATYGEDENGVYVVVTYNQIPTILDRSSSDFLFNSTSTSGKPITISRLGYTFSGLFYNFDATERFNSVRDIEVTPIWTRNSQVDTMQANISWASEYLEGLSTFYLLNSQDIFIGTISDLSVGSTPITITPSLMLENGEQLIDYGYILTYRDGTEQTITLRETANFNINALSKQAQYTIRFFVTVSDTLYNTASNTSHTDESDTITFNMVKNSFAFDSNFVSVYNGTNEFVPALASGGYTNVNDYGRVYIRYAYDGQEIAEAYRTYISVTEFFRSESFALTGGDYNVGTNKDLTFNINTSYFSTHSNINDVIVTPNTNWADLINDVAASGSNYAFTYFGGVEIVKARFTINFGVSSTYYFEDTELIVYTHDGSNITFSIGDVDFTYTLTNIIYTGGYHEEDTTFTGENDSDVFEVRGLRISGQDFSRVSGSFEYVLNGQFSLLNSDNALKLSYSPRYLIAANGQLSMLALDYRSVSDNIYIDNIMVGSQSVEATGAQMTYRVGNQVVFSYVNNNSPQFLIYINRAILSTYSLTFDIFVDISTDRLQSLTPLAWNSSSDISTYDSMLDGNFVDPASVYHSYTITLSTQNTTTYAVLTDVRKIHIDYNGGHNASGASEEVIYVSALNSGYVHTNPVHDYAGLEFDGYSYSCQDPVITASGDTGYRFTTSDGGQSVDVVALWSLVGVTGSQIQDSFTYRASLDSLSLNVTDIVSLPTLEGGSFSYTLSNGQNTFTASSGIITIQDSTGRAPSTLSGDYTLTVYLTYQNDTQGSQRITREFPVELNILTNEIGITNQTTIALIFNNVARETQINVGVRQNGTRVETLSLNALIEDGLSDYGVNVTITYNSSAVSQVLNAGRYTITISIASEYQYFFSLESGYTTIIQIVEQYEIDLSLYEDQINLSKDLGFSDPTLSATITITENANDQVVVNFTREEGENIGFYRLTNPTLASAEDRVNYTINAQDFEDYFEILVPTANLRIDLDGTLSFAYNGNALSNLTVSYDSAQGKFVLTGYAGQEAVSQTFSMFYTNASGEQSPIPEDARVDYARYVVFTPAENNSAYVGSYDFSVAFSEEGETVIGQDAEQPSFTATSSANAKIVVTERVLTVTSITKVLDQTTNFIWTNQTQNPNITMVVENIVDGEYITITGSFFQSYAGYQSIVSMSLDNVSDENYQLTWASSLQVLVTPSQETVNVTTTVSSLVYGTINMGDELNRILTNIPLTINNGAINSNYITISSYTVSGSGVYSTGGHLRAGSRTFEFTLTSTNYTFGQAVGDVGEIYSHTYNITINITAKQLDLARISTSIVKFYDTTNSFPDIDIDLSNYGIESGDNVIIDKTNSHFDNENVGTNKVVTIILGGSDSTNYTVLNNVTGTINQHAITFTVNATQEDPALVTDGAFVDDGLSPVVRNNVFSFTYPNNYSASQLISQMIYPTRTGYQAVGWKYYSEGQYIEITEGNIQALIESIALNGESKTIVVYTVWEIENYSITIRGNNLQSVLVEGDFYNSDDETARYFSSLTISVETNRGYKISSYNVASGTYRDATLSDTGANTGVATISNIGSAIVLEINTGEIEITFNIDDNVPLYTERTETNILYATYTYVELGSLLQSDLAVLAVTEGTYSFMGYSYGGTNTPIGESTLQEVVDALFEQLSQDVQIELTAIWQGETYQISFNPNGGQLIGNSPITAIYGSELQGMPEAYLPGRSYVWVDNYDVEYVEGDIFHTIGTNSNGQWQTTLTARFTNNPYTLTVVFDDKIIASADGAEITTGMQFTIVYSENIVTITASAVQGYEFEFNVSELNGEHDIDGNVIQIYNLIDDGTLTIDTLLGLNRLSLGVQNIESYSVAIDGETQSDVLTEYEVYTESTVVITYNAIKGYEFDDTSVVYSTTTSSVTYIISDDKHTLTLTWSNFVDGITINVTANPSLNIITIPNISDRFTSLQLNGVSVSVNGTTYEIYSDTPLTLTATLRYGYMNGSVNPTIDEFLVAGQTCTYTRADGLYHLSASFTGINDSFALEFGSEERSYNFMLVVAEGQSEYGKIVPDVVSQTVRFNGELSLQANPIRDDYIFFNWTGNGSVLSSEQYTTLTMDLSQRALLESVDLGGTILVYANFIENLNDVTFTVGNRGQIAVSQTGISDFTVSGGRSVVVTTRINADLIITLIPDEGYELNEILVGELPLAECGFEYSYVDGVLTLTPTLVDSFTEVEITFKASEAYVHVQTAVQVNYQFTYGTDIGGLIYISDASGTRLDDSLYLNAEGTMYIDFEFLSYTDEIVYFTADINSGFSLVMSSSTTGVVASEMDYNGVHIYAFSGIKDGTEIQATFTAEENNIEIKFAREGSSAAVSAGRISVGTSSELIRASQNNTNDVFVSAITGANLDVTLYSQFAYNLVANAGGALRYRVELLDGQFDEGAITVSNVAVSDPSLNGFTNTATLHITNVNADAIIYIIVEPKVYDLIFSLSYGDTNYQVRLEDAIVYGETFSLANLSDEDRATIFTTRSGYTLAGYFTKQAGQGVQYVDGNGNVLKAWTETGYTWDGNRYIAETNFDVETQTFTIYAAWLYDKSTITLIFRPEGFDSNLDDAEIDDIITNINQTTYWTSQDDKWYAEVTAGVTLRLQAYEYEGYEFMYWEVTSTGGETTQHGANFEMVFDLGDYQIRAIYYPIFTLTTNNDGGISYLQQNGTALTGNVFSPDDILTLVAVPKDGYNFLYWINTDTNARIYGTYDENSGNYYYTYDSLVTTPLNLYAVFEGRPVNINLETSKINNIHRIVGVYIDNVLVDHSTTMLGAIGQTMQIVIDKGWGYNLTIPCGLFTESLNSVTGYYEYTYRLNAADLDIIGDVYNLYVTMDLVREDISITFTSTVRDAVDDAEYARAGSQIYVDANELAYELNNGDTYQVLYGDSATLRIYTSTAYLIDDIRVNVGDAEISILYMIEDSEDNEIIINQAFLDMYETYSITINVIYKRMVWSDEEYRASGLIGMGTDDSPYFIRSAEEMGFVSYAVNNALTNNNGLAYADAVYRVVADIDFYGLFWEPIGVPESPFNGTMYLESYDLTDIRLYRTYSNPNVSYGGLFWCLTDNASIIQDNMTLIIVLIVIGVIILLLLLLLLLLFLLRKRKRRKMEEIANA